MEDKNDGQINIFWFRRDLRLHDNAGLYHALRSGLPVLPVFIFDTEILEILEDRDDARVMFIHDEISRIHEKMKKEKSGLFVAYGNPIEIFRELTGGYSINTVFCNRDYEPYAKNRDAEIEKFLGTRGIRFLSIKDQVIFEKNEILNNQGEPYKVFTPYKKVWLSEFNRQGIKPFSSENHLSNLLVHSPGSIPGLGEMGFKRSSIRIPSRKIDPELIGTYDKNRDFPSREGTSRLGIHLRHGTISIREAVRTGAEHNQTWLSELIWREFYMMILDFFPEVVEYSFRREYDRIVWKNEEENFRRWCDGTTGYPIVDAGMRELNATGYMHNRVRMITASFLTKHLLIDWRWGEAWFGRKLLDYELSSNNGGWQWAAGTGTDAQPYFRVFNPEAQAEKFDPEKTYIRKWVPEFETESYPEPIIEHTFARKRAIETYKKIKD